MNKEHKYIVYMHTAPNNKKYIGITFLSPEKRWGVNGYGYKKQIKFYRAIKKYGWENFKHEILYTNLTKAEAEQKEIELIKLYDSKNNGYNSDDGGKGSSGHSVSEESKKVMSSLKKGKALTETNYISLCKAAEKRRLNIYVYDILGNLLYTFSGYDDVAKHLAIPVSTIRNFCAAKLVYKDAFIFLTDKNKNLLQVVINNYNSIRQSKELITIEQYTIEGDFINGFKTYKEASEKLNIPLGTIGKICSGFDLAYKNKFIFIKPAFETIQERLDKIKNSKKRDYSIKKYKIEQYNINGRLLNSFDTYNDAAVATGVNKSAIIANCTGKVKTCMGKKYIFKKVRLVGEKK